MLPPATITFPGIVLGLHILGAVIGFGATFAFPFLFAASARRDPTVLPWLLRARQRVGRYLVNPGLALVVVCGIYLATDLHQWSQFYVGWGIVAAILIGALEGGVIIPRTARLAARAEQDLAATAVPAGGQRTSATWSSDFLGGYRTVSAAGVVTQLIVIVTVLIMATQA